jgi:hypothetical protein
MADKPLMPKATAVWLVENTSLSFQQIADFCGLHPLEVKGIADEDVAQGIKGLDPITSNQLTRDEIERGQADPNYKLRLQKSIVVVPTGKGKQRKRPKYVPVSKRQDRPNAIVWLVRSHPELSDAQVIRLVGTTKSTIEKIRDRSHASMSSFQPVDPVALGLCTQAELDTEVEKAAKRVEAGTEQPTIGEPMTLLPTEETILARPEYMFGTPQPMIGEPTGQGLTSAERARKEADSVFANFPKKKDTEGEGEGEDESDAG